MLSKITLSFNLILALVAVGASAVEFIELNDANKNMMSLELGKGVQVIQEAIANEFNFGSVKDAVKFATYCGIVKEEMQTAKDDNHQGLAGKIKALLTHPEVEVRCRASPAEVQAYEKLDEKLEGYMYLRRSLLAELVETYEKVESDEALSKIFKPILEKRAQTITKTLLEKAAQDTAFDFEDLQPKAGPFDMMDRYKQGCAIETLEPICRLVRRTSHLNASAVGHDFTEFYNALEMKDSAKLEKHYKESGVDMEQVKEVCSQNMKKFRSMVLIDEYMAAHIMDPKDVEETMRKDVDFDVLYNMYHLCVVAERH